METHDADRFFNAFTAGRSSFTDHQTDCDSVVLTRYYGCIPLEGTDPYKTVLVLDVETTGLDEKLDEVIELSVVRCTIDKEGRPVSVEHGQYYRQPSKPISPEITALTGITDDMVRGYTIDDTLLQALFVGVDYVVAHNAQFDWRFVTALYPAAAELPWCCSLRDIGWQELGVSGGNLEFLVAAVTGHFYAAHGALVDASALTFLLSHERGDPPQTLMHRCLAGAMEPLYMVAAIGTPRSAADALRSIKCRWNGRPNCFYWWKQAKHRELADVYKLVKRACTDWNGKGVLVRQIPLADRYDEERWAQPFQPYEDLDVLPADISV